MTANGLSSGEWMRVRELVAGYRERPGEGFP